MKENHKRACYIGIIISYIILLSTVLYFSLVDSDYNGSLPQILIIIGLIIFFGSFFALHDDTKDTHAENPQKNTVDTILKFICWIPALPIFVAFFLLFFIIYLPYSLFSYMKNNLRKQTAYLRKKGFILTKKKLKKRTVYYLRRDDQVIKIIPDFSYEISFDGGHSYVSIINSPLGTKEEREKLAELTKQYCECDYRDKDLYQQTPAFIAFLNKYIY